MNHSKEHNKWESIDSNSNETQMGTIHIEWLNRILPYISLVMSISYNWGTKESLALSPGIPIPIPS